MSSRCRCTDYDTCQRCEDAIARIEDARSGSATRDEDRMADFAADRHFLGDDR